MLRKISAAFTVLACVLVLAGCGGEKVYQDGIYSAQFKEYDSYGYKDFLTVTVKDGAVTEMVYNGISEDGTLRTDDSKLQNDMESTQGTYPKKYTSDLVNQFLEAQDIKGVDAVAGASWSSESFKTLFKELEDSIYKGDTALVEVDNVPEK